VPGRPVTTVRRAEADSPLGAATALPPPRERRDAATSSRRAVRALPRDARGALAELLPSSPRRVHGLPRAAAPPARCCARLHARAAVAARAGCPRCGLPRHRRGGLPAAGAAFALAWAPLAYEGVARDLVRR
jgi:hypothetical protein